MQLRDVGQQNRKDLSLFNLLPEFRIADATNPRDRVYALLGLLPEATTTALDRAGLRPDYKIPLSECYRRTAPAILSVDNNLDILSTPRPLEKDPSVTLPSWASDWANSKTILISPLLRDVDIDDHQSNTARPFSACGNYLKHRSSLRDNDVSGFTTDRIVGVANGVIPIVEELLDKLMENFDAIDRSGKKELFIAVAGLDMRQDLTKTLQAWESFALSYPTYPTGEDIQKVLCTVMCASNMPDGLDATFREFKAFMGEYSWPKRVNNFKAFGFQKSKRHDHAVGLAHLLTVNRKKDVHVRGNDNVLPWTEAG